MWRHTVSDFLVETNGHCFICLRKASPLFHSNSDGLSRDPATTPSSYSSVHSLSQYLKMDMSKVFHEKESIPLELLDNVKRSKLKVSLCEQCSKWNKKIAELCRQLEKIETEVSFYLELVQGGLLRSNEDESADLLYKMGKDASNGGSLERMRIVKALRMDAIEKCSHKLKAAHQPRLKVQNLTVNQVCSKKQRMKRKSRKPTTFPKSDVQNLSDSATHFSDGGHVKTEDSQSDADKNDYFGVVDDDCDPEYMDYSNWNEERDVLQNSVGWEEDHPHSNLDDNLHIRQTGSTYTSVKTEKRGWEDVPVPISSETVLPPTSSTKKVQKLTFAINPTTGKYNCNICSVDAPSKANLKIHYESVHLKIKHKCNLCGKEFATKSNYNAHHRTAHVGVRFKCNLCGKCFTAKQKLNLHQQSAHLGTK